MASLAMLVNHNETIDNQSSNYSNVSIKEEEEGETWHGLEHKL